MKVKGQREHQRPGLWEVGLKEGVELKRMTRHDTISLIVDCSKILFVCLLIVDCSHSGLGDFDRG
jgi:hypothetical protein